MGFSSESLLPEYLPSVARKHSDDADTQSLLCKESCHFDAQNQEPTKLSSSLVSDKDFQNLPWFHEIGEELKSLLRISMPTTVTGLLVYFRNLISMIFLGYLGQAELAAGSLSIGFANITGYSIIFGLAMGMEPICGQAYGAQKWKLLSLTFHRTVVILLFTSLAISICWLNADIILLHLGQDETIVKLAKTYLLYSLPDLIAQSILHPLRIYLRTQSIAQPIAVCSAVASVIHIPINYFLVITMKKGIKGVAMAVAITNFNLLIFLALHVCFTGVLKKTWTRLSLDCFEEWRSYLSLAIPSCISICLEWWWYELLIILSGLLENPQETVSAVGILIQMTSLVYVFPSSLSFGVSTRVANELGAGRPAGARRAAFIGTASGAFTGVVATGFTIRARSWWGRMFTVAPGLLRLVTAALPIVGLCELGNCPQTAMCGILRGSARADLAAHVNLGGFYGVGLPMGLAMGFWVGLGFVGLWLGLLAAQLTCAVTLGVVLLKTDWGVQVKRAEVITGAEKVVEVEGDDSVKMWLGACRIGDLEVSKKVIHP